MEKQKQHGKLTSRDFTIAKCIGKGSYGKVFLVKKNDNDKYYAMKVLKKKEMKKNGQVEHTMAERRILGLITSDFIVCLRYAF